MLIQPVLVAGSTHCDLCGFGLTWLFTWDSVLAIPARSDTVRTLQSEARSQGEALEGFAKTRVALAERMTPAQFAEAQRLAREWKPKTWDELKQGL